MIISHKYKYIFFKPKKVAGTSVEVALAKHCGSSDIIAPVSKYSSRSDEDSYDHPARNYDGFYNHILPSAVKKKVSAEIWNNYYKFTIVRNPWDQVVSRYFWMKKNTSKRGPITKEKVFSNILNPLAYSAFVRRIFSKPVVINNLSDLVNNFNCEWKNTDYYFDKQGNPICDFYIKFENLQEDYEKVCKKQKIPYEKLPKLKTRFRKNQDYRCYYNEFTEEKIRNLFKKEIDFFGYKF